MFDAGECDGKPYKDYFGDISKLCGMSEVVFDASVATLAEGEAPKGVYYKLYAVPNTKAFNLGNAKLEIETHEASIMLKDLGVFANNYGYVVCTNGKCDTALNRLSMSKAEKPHVCYE